MITSRCLCYLVILLLVFVLVGPSMLAQERIDMERDPVLVSLQSRCDQFLEDLSLGETERSFDKLLANSPLNNDKANIKTLADKADLLESKYGKCRAFEQVDVNRIGKDVVLLKSLYKCEDHPVVWYFTYYRDFRPSDGVTDSNDWIVIAVRFDTDLELLGVMTGSNGDTM